MSADELFTKMPKPERLKAIQLLIDNLEYCEFETFIDSLDCHLSKPTTGSKTRIEDHLNIDIGEEGDCLKIKIEDVDDNAIKFSTIENSTHTHSEYSEDKRNDGKYMCQWEDCKKLFKSKGQYRRHFYGYHKNGNEKRRKQKGNFACELCKKRFSQESMLNSHIVLHSEETLFSCSHCYKKFTRPEKAKTCESSHSGIFKHSCHLCDYKTQQKSNLDCHVNYHLNIKPFSCPICPFKSFEKRGLKNHVKKSHATAETNLFHLEEKYPHLYKPSTPMDDWRNHPQLTPPSNHYKSSEENKRKKENTRPSKCAKTGPKSNFKLRCRECGYKTRDQFNLNRHMNYHFKSSEENKLKKENTRLSKCAKTGPKSNFKLRCHECGYKTRDQFNLNRHMNYHFKIKKYSCCMCEFKSFDNRDLKNHIEKKHVTGN